MGEIRLPFDCASRAQIRTLKVSSHDAAIPKEDLYEHHEE